MPFWFVLAQQFHEICLLKIEMLKEYALLWSSWKKVRCAGLEKTFLGMDWIRKINASSFLGVAIQLLIA